MTDKLKRIFVVIGETPEAKETFAYYVVLAKTPREAASAAFRAGRMPDLVEVFELGRGRRYTQQTAAVPVGKAQ